jgi:hypothetical protein
MTDQEYAAHDKAVNDNSQAARREVARALGMPFEDEREKLKAKTK